MTSDAWATALLAGGGGGTPLPGALRDDLGIERDMSPALMKSHTDKAAYEAAQVAAAKPDPDDVYHMTPVNWSTAPAEPGPKDPGTWTRPAIVLLQKQPLPWKRPDGQLAPDHMDNPRSPYSRSRDLMFAERYNQAFDEHYDEAVRIWNGAAGSICGFNDAAKESAGNGLEGLGGAAFDPPAANKKGDNLDAYADAQMVGGDDKKVSVASLFKGDQPNVDFGKIKKSQAFDDGPLTTALITAENGVAAECNNLEAGLLLHRQCGEDVRTALMAVEVAKEGVSAVDWEKSKANLGVEKARWAVGIDGATKILTSVIDGLSAASKLGGDNPLDAGLGLIKAGVSMTGTISRMVTDVTFDNKIYAVDQMLLQIKTSIMDKQEYIAKANLDKAIRALEADARKVKNLKIAVQNAAVQRRRAYNSLAEAAGKNAVEHGASAADGARIEAAIRAVPLVETVVARIQDVRQRLTIPAYTPFSGMGYRAAGQPRDFLLGIVHLKGYVELFVGYEKKWQTRLSGLQKLVGSLYTKA
ncbi:MAG TPA: hypothetical protein VL172_03485 [Kofleriaceae bacterium]|nr:hypothetical protein [Kofleriaceae bacterium]